ncbi:hypothetical protein PA598K_04004 [Paenibacillus sp. 598K]|uniref:acyl carrier protein n=1 Tax=Paenibacillus sp. 598K TaxID=1117987 RepID=UPI000FF9190E|nr:acyl carrier protein [Paenibacillus sp. 598K]GBF75586.1 hypothetical protein PA598K_04004 [Paenibacillus sp. 598K]
MSILSTEIEILSKVKEVLVVEEREINLKENLGAIGLDSMKSVQLIVELEELFNISFDDEELMFENFSTIQKITTMVNEKLVSSV